MNKYIIPIAFILISLALRLTPQFQHSEIGMLFSPILAIALFSGAYMSKKLAFSIPLIIMGITDYFIGYYDIKLMASVYGCFLLTVFLGRLLKNKKVSNVIIGSVGCCIAYYLITNFAFWAFTPWYAKTVHGLIACYIAGLPYFANSITGTFIYSVSLFGIYELLKNLVYEKKILTNISN